MAGREECGNFAAMKSKQVIARTYLAIVLLLLAVVVPHHHHEGGAACWAIEICPSDGDCNDEHTHHHDEQPNGQRSACSLSIAPMKAGTVRAEMAPAPMPLLPYLAWSNLLPDPHSITSNQQRSEAGAVPLYACSQSKHCPRRGPPVC